MRRSIILILVITACYSPTSGQSDTISLIKCLVAAREHAAIKPQMDILSDISGLKVENAGYSNLPTLSAYGKAWYQSDAMAIPSQNPNAPGLEVEKFQYNFGLEANQKIFDGGLAKKSKELEIASGAADKGKVETDIYQLNNEVVRYFFSYILFKENIKVFELKSETLKKRIGELESGVKNGLVKKNDLDKIQAELLLSQQQILDLESKCSQSLNGLGMLTGFEMTENPILIVPDSIINGVSGLRPEIDYFDAEKQRLDKAIGLKSRQNLPKLFAYGQLGYSYPGLNFYENKDDYYYIIGAKLSWTLYDWKQVKRDKMVLMKQEEIIDTRKNDFERNIGIQIENEQLEQEKLLSVIEMDDEIIKQRESISRGSTVSLENGVITTSTYIDDLNAEMKARIDLETHKIQYLNSLVKVYLYKGIDVRKY
jgi:outer membrane protein TolC